MSKHYSKMPSVAFVTYNYYPGMGSTDSYEYTQALAKNGWEVQVIAASNKSAREINHKKGVKVTSIPVNTIKRISINNPKFSIKAREALKRSKADLIHVFSYAGCSILRLNQASKISKWIYDLRSGSIQNKITNIVGKKIIDFESSLYDATFYIDEAFIPKNKPKYILPLGVNTSRFKPIKIKPISAAKNIIYVGSLSKTREIENLVRAFKGVNRSCREAQLFLVGSGDGEAIIKKTIKKLGLENSVTLTGFIPYARIPEILSMADIAISYIPKKPQYEYQPPIKTLEYLSSSLAVIATDTYGNRVYVKGGENGLLVGDDIQELSDSIIKLLTDNDLREKIISNARKSIIQYDYQNIVKDFLIPNYIKILD